MCLACFPRLDIPNYVFKVLYLRQFSTDFDSDFRFVNRVTKCTGVTGG